jgi:hypothetical protein
MLAPRLANPGGVSQKAAEHGSLTPLILQINQPPSTYPASTRQTEKALPYSKNPCQRDGLLEQWIETTFQVVSILNG